jgi:hypothetical protein
MLSRSNSATRTKKTHITYKRIVNQFQSIEMASELLLFLTKETNIPERIGGASASLPIGARKLTIKICSSFVDTTQGNRYKRQG